jgi:hypothetical protein
MKLVRLALAGTVQLAGVCVSANCLAEIHVFRCLFDNQLIYFTRYTDGTPARVGTGIGVGDKAIAFEDRSGALVFIETNIDGTPITFTSIEPSLKAVNSRHILQSNGTVLAPSHRSGGCEPLSFKY